jgi:hypothetical protein
MKKNELRIFNWVRRKESDTNIQIEQYLLCESELGNYIPIRLTEKWLLKFGFEWKQIKDVSSYTLSKLEIYQYSSNNNKIFFEYSDGEVELKYVHQLQNLYFALTGNELIYLRD